MKSGEGGRSDRLVSVNDGTGRSGVDGDAVTGQGRPRCFKRNNECQLMGCGCLWMRRTAVHRSSSEASGGSVHKQTITQRRGNLPQSFVSNNKGLFQKFKSRFQNFGNGGGSRGEVAGHARGGQGWTGPGTGPRPAEAPCAGKLGRANTVQRRCKTRTTKPPSCRLIPPGGRRPRQRDGAGSSVHDCACRPQGACPMLWRCSS